MRYEQRVNLSTFKPLLRAYALGYVTATGPRIFGLLRKCRRSNLKWQEQFALLCSILITSTQLNRFPTACAILVGGATAAPRLVAAVLQVLLSWSSQRKRLRLNNSADVYIRALCSFVAAWLAFALLNRDDAWTRKRAASRANTTVDIADSGVPKQDKVQAPSNQPRYAGKTIDFTSFAFCRALDLVAITAWTQTRARSWHLEKRSPRLASLLCRTADPSIFALSAAVIMWSWFYSPERLPRAYNHWISKIANIDVRLIQALRLVRQGDFVYGEDTGQAALLAGLCQDLGLPREYADPTKTVPIPCELYHCGTGKNCEYHALTRF